MRVVMAGRGWIGLRLVLAVTSFVMSLFTVIRIMVCAPVLVVGLVGWIDISYMADMPFALAQKKLQPYNCTSGRVLP